VPNKEVFPDISLHRLLRSCKGNPNLYDVVSLPSAFV
jgi:hypothetical protein